MKILSLVGPVETVASDEGKELGVEQACKERTNGENNENDPKREVVEPVEQGLNGKVLLLVKLDAASDDCCQNTHGKWVLKWDR